MFQHTNDESKHAWEENADYWDAKMGDNSNTFHREIVRPHTEELLAIKRGDLVLDIACGNGNFSQRISENGARVVAFDYSERLIEHAKRRRSAYLNEISFHVCDATQYDAIISLKKDKPFDKAVANMAVMDISNIEPLFNAVYDLLSSQGTFVFSSHHPCFTRPDNKYKTACVHKGEAIVGQPVLQNYYHRSFQDVLSLAFRIGFVLDGFYEDTDDSSEFPIIFIARLKKVHYPS